MILNARSRVRPAAAAAVLMAAGILQASLPAGAQQAPRFSRSSLARTASFVVTNTLTPKGGSKVSQVMRVEVKGNKARVEYNNPQLGGVTYLANEKGVFFYVPANKVAQRQRFEGGADAALQLAFRQVNQQLQGAKKVGTARVSGQPTDIYKDPKSGATIYVGRAAGFRLPVKTELKNEGGTRTLLVTNIKTNVALADARFTLPAGVQIIESTGAAGGPGMPGMGR